MMGLDSGFRLSKTKPLVDKSLRRYFDGTLQTHTETHVGGETSPLRSKLLNERNGLVTTLTGLVNDGFDHFLPPKPGTRYWPFLYYPALFFATTQLPQSPLGVTSPKAIRIPEFPLSALTKILEPSPRLRGFLASNRQRYP